MLPLVSDNTSRSRLKISSSIVILKVFSNVETKATNSLIPSISTIKNGMQNYPGLDIAIF